jgi:hypothetical protein
MEKKFVLRTKEKYGKNKNPLYFDCEDERGSDMILSFEKRKYASVLTKVEVVDYLTRYPEEKEDVDIVEVSGDSSWFDEIKVVNFESLTI